MVWQEVEGFVAFRGGRWKTSFKFTNPLFYVIMELNRNNVRITIGLECVLCSEGGCWFLNIMLKFMQYLAKKLIAIAILIWLAILVTFTAYDWANIYIVVTEGMTQRATAVLDGQENIVLNKFFTSSYLNSDPLLNNNQYEDFIIQDYNLKLRIKWLWVWPWSDSARVVIEEEIPKIVAKPRSENQEIKTPPSWQNGEKIILLQKRAGLWKIDGIIFKKPLK